MPDNTDGPAADDAGRSEDLDPGPATARAAMLLDAPPFEPLEARLHPPRARLELVRREALLARLQRSRAALVLVSASPGSGKTTLLSQWSATVGRPCAWLQLGAGDDDPVVLLTYLAFALSRVAPVDPVLYDLLRLPIPPVEERILPMLALAVSEAPSFVFVLDDAHHLTNERCWRAIAVVVDHLPRGAQLGLGTRVDPPLPLAKMLAGGSLLEIRTPDLAFDEHEAAQLFGRYARDPDDATIQALLTATEGWATGLYLASLAGRDRPFGDWPALVSGDRREIAAFLTSEALDNQPAEIQEFLLHTSILDWIEPAACRALTGRTDAHDLLLRLAGENLFVTAVAGHSHSFRYHPLFAELLRLELVGRDAETAVTLHRRASEWFSARGDLDAALRHRLAAGDVDEAAEFVSVWWRALWQQGLVETTRRWLASFTDEQILAHAALTLTAGWVYSALDDVKRGRLWGSRACSVAVDDRPSPDGAASLRSSQALLRATLARDGIGAMRNDAELAARIETTPGTSWYAEAKETLGAARWLSGAARAAIRPLQIAAREGHAFNWSAELAALGLLALVSVDEDRWTEADEYARRAEERLAELEFGSDRRILPMLLARARILAHGGDQRARLAETQAVEVLERMVPNPWMHLLAAVVLGEVDLELQDLAAAERWSARAREALERYPDAGMLRGRAERLRSALEQARIREPLTPAEHRVLELLPTHLTDREMAERLFVSKNTVKTHLRGLYRKLEAGTRSEAVERARELGLLKTG